MGRRPVPGKTVQFVDVVSQSYRPRGCSPPSPPLTREACDAQHVEELFSIFINDSFLQKPFLVRDARFSRETIKGVSRLYDGFLISGEHEKSACDNVDVAVDPGPRFTIVDAVELRSRSQLVSIKCGDAPNANDRMLGHDIDTAILVIEEARHKDADTTVDALRCHPIRHQNFIIVSLVRSSPRNETVWRNDHLEESPKSILGGTGVPHVADAVSHFGNHPQCLLKTALSCDRRMCTGRAALNHRGSLEIARRVVRVPPNSSLKSDTPGTSAPHQSKYSYPLACSSFSRKTYIATDAPLVRPIAEAPAQMA